MPESQLKFNTPMIEFTTGKDIPNITIDGMKALGIESFIPTGDAQKDTQKQQEINKILEDRREEFPKFTFGDVLNQLFDSIPMPTNSDFEVYASVLKDIRNAKSRKQDTIPVSIHDLEKLKKLFTKPPKEHLNKKCAFLVECLDTSLVVK